MPNRDTRRRGKDPTLDRWLKVTDNDDNTYQIYFKDVSGKDEWDFLMQTQHNAGGLCDMFLEGKVTLIGIAGLIWSQRRKFEKKLTLQEVLKTVSMATIETLEMFDPDEAEEAEEARTQTETVDMQSGQALPGFGGNSDRSSPDSAPSTV